MNASFNSQLTAFQNWAKSVSPDFGAQVDRVVSDGYISQLGALTAEPITNRSPAEVTADKLGSLIDSVGNTYLKSVEAYYMAKGKVADLKLASKGNYATQAITTAQGAIATPPTNLLLIGGLGLAAVLLLARR